MKLSRRTNARRRTFPGSSTSPKARTRKRTGEYQRLKALGCVGANTVLVHGVGLTDEDIADAAPRVCGLVTCYTTNDYLLGKTFDIIKWLEAGGKLGIGSDSRLTAESDLMMETFRFASETVNYFPYREDWSVVLKFTKCSNNSGTK